MLTALLATIMALLILIAILLAYICYYLKPLYSRTVGILNTLGNFAQAVAGSRG